MATPIQEKTVFFLGATGYIGSQFLVLLAQELPLLKIQALVRPPVAEKKKLLQNIHANISVVEGALHDGAIIEEYASKVDIVINAASSDHLPSVKSILAGLEKNSASNTGRPPLYIHVSGTGIVSDNCRGNHVDFEKLPIASDIGLDLNACEPTNMHLPEDKAIVTAGTRRENPVRTIIVFPGWVYGIGEGIQKTTLPLRLFLGMFSKVGHAGTWGEGLNRACTIHVKDVARALLVVLSSALENKADEGAQGLYFAVSTRPPMTVHEWASRLGDIMFNKGILKERGSRPFADDAIEYLGEYGWSLLGGNLVVKPERLSKKLGWQASESVKASILDRLTEEVEEALKLAEFRDLNSHA
ncbi:hypothetical protein HGRIS_009876 [Hohenbuehelia grisea]|uniref:NmrA-like domain-containing protein n=1 Tax=Hohenbuehelia grisea TaxID=104357 RepID=A0ABR3J2Q1_9AGAR